MIVFDTGALIGIERGSNTVRSILEYATAQRIPITMPSGVLAQAWRNDPRQHALSRLLNSGLVSVVAMDENGAKAVGSLLAKSGTADVIDAHVIIVARAARARFVVTSDPDDLRALDPGMRLEVV